MSQATIETRLERAIEKGETNLREHVRDGHMGRVYIDGGAHEEWYAQSLSLLQTVFGTESTYAKHFAKEAEGSTDNNVERGLGVVRAALEDVSNGYLWTVSELIHAETFDSFLEQAAHLLEAKYKDAAAVIAGSTLEEHLRALGTKHGVPISATNAKGKTESRAAATISDELKVAGAYNQIENSTVQGFLALRNQAAHGHYKEYEAEQVRSMIDGIRSFMLRNPA